MKERETDRSVSPFSSFSSHLFPLPSPAFAFSPVHTMTVDSTDRACTSAAAAAAAAAVALWVALPAGIGVSGAEAEARATMEVA